MHHTGRSLHWPVTPRNHSQVLKLWTYLIQINVIQCPKSVSGFEFSIKDDVIKYVFSEQTIKVNKKCLQI